MSSLQAFPRADGSVGIRNIVLVVSTVTCANTVVNHIAWKTGAVPLTHERGCVEGEQSFRRTMQMCIRDRSPTTPRSMRVRPPRCSPRMSSWMMRGFLGYHAE